MELVVWANTHFEQNADVIVREACKLNRFDIVLYFIDQLSEKEKLFAASALGYLEIVKHLIEECHCDPDTQDNSDWTALSYAAEKKHEDIVQYLVEKCKATITDRIIQCAKPLKMKTYLREQLKKQNSNQNQ